MTYFTTADMPIAVVGVQVAEAIDNANIDNKENKNPESIFISGNSSPCLIDVLMYGALRQLKELNSVGCLADTGTTNWFNTMDNILEVLLIRRKLQYSLVCF